MGRRGWRRYGHAALRVQRDVLRVDKGPGVYCACMQVQGRVSDRALNPRQRCQDIV